VIIVTRPVRLEQRAEWGDTRIAGGSLCAWRNVVSGQAFPAAATPAEILADCGAAALLGTLEQSAVGVR
jgi:hypothetical protein